MQSKPKALALIVITLEIIICFLIYFLCSCIRRRQQESYNNQPQTYKTQNSNVSRNSPTLDSILVFFKYSSAKALIGKTMMSLKCASCHVEFKDMSMSDETLLRLMPKCRHVFHPKCVLDPCSVKCPCCEVDAEVLALDLNTKGEMCECECEDQGQGEIESDLKLKVEADEAEKVLDIMLEDDKENTIRLPEDVMEKIIAQAMLVLPTGRIYSPT